MKKVIFVSLALSFACTCVVGQGAGNLLEISYSRIVPSNLTTDIPAGSPIPQIGWNTLDIGVIGPVFKAKDSSHIVLTNLSFSRLTFVYKESANLTSQRPEALYNTGLTANFIKPFQGKRLLSIFGSIRLATDFENFLDGRDILVMGGATYFPNMSAKWKIGYGVVTTFVFGERLLFPIIVLKHTSPDGKFNFDLSFPRLMVDKKIGGSVALGLGAAFNGAQFNVENRVLALSSETLDYVRFSYLNLGPYIDWRFYKAFHLNISAGITAAKKFEIFNTQNNEIADGVLNTKNSTFFTARVYWSLGDQK